MLSELNRFSMVQVMGLVGWLHPTGLLTGSPK